MHFSRLLCLLLPQNSNRICLPQALHGAFTHTPAACREGGGGGGGTGRQTDRLRILSPAGHHPHLPTMLCPAGRLGELLGPRQGGRPLQQWEGREEGGGWRGTSALFLAQLFLYLPLLCTASCPYLPLPHTPHTGTCGRRYLCYANFQDIHCSFLPSLLLVHENISFYPL